MTKNNRFLRNSNEKYHFLTRRNLSNVGTPAEVGITYQEDDFCVALSQF